MKAILFHLALAAQLTAAGLRAGDWPNWRGPAGNGTAAGAYPARWTTNDLAWRIELPGKGGSTPVVWRDRVYLTTPAEGQDAVLALDGSGKQLWLTRLGPASPPKHRTLASSCNASPVTDGKTLFAQFRSGLLVAMDLDGQVRWRKNLVERFGPDNLYWDHGSSPAIVGGLLIVERLHQGESWVAGFDLATGELRWRQPRNYETAAEGDNGYTTPVGFEYRGKPAFLVWGGEHLTAHSAAEGKLLWSCGGFNPKRMPNWPAIATPVVHEGMAIVPIGRDDRKGQAMVDGIRLDGEGDVTATHRAWRREDVGVFACTPAEYEGRVYLLQNRGGRGLPRSGVRQDPLGGRFSSERRQLLRLARRGRTASSTRLGKTEPCSPPRWGTSSNCWARTRWASVSWPRRSWPAAACSSAVTGTCSASVDGRAHSPKGPRR